jgi:tRNA-2-methylthio-N6-dimethylallyladenosine synthase
MLEKTITPTQNNSGKKLFIKTYGCQMNVYDSAVMANLLKPHGYSLVTDFPEADLVILNTCHIREKASEKVYSELGRIRQAKEERKANGHSMLICVAGCVAQAEGEEIIKRAPFVDIVVGSQSYHELPTLLEQVRRQKKWAINIDFPENSKFDHLPSPSEQQSASVFLSIQEGCDKFCHFCVVPYTRGAEYSRPVAEIYREAIKLVSLGAKEITLLGQNVTGYHGDNGHGGTWNIAKLLKQLAKIDGLQRLRYTTSHPREIDDELISLHGNEEKLMPFLHLPVQSGSNSILKAMNRKHDRAHYLQVIQKLRAARPDMAFSSDFIVGYPGETEADFADTMDLVEQVNYAQCFSFKYSQRPGTPAAALGNQVNEEIKAERLQRLQALLNNQQNEFNANSVGKTIEVLFDKPGKLPNQYQGKTPYLQTVNVVSNSDLMGKTIGVKITKALSNTLVGELCDDSL